MIAAATLEIAKIDIKCIQSDKNFTIKFKQTLLNFSGQFGRTSEIIQIIIWFRVSNRSRPLLAKLAGIESTYSASMRNICVPMRRFRTRRQYNRQCNTQHMVCRMSRSDFSRARRNNVFATHMHAVYTDEHLWCVALKCVKITSNQRAADPRPVDFLSPSFRNLSPESHPLERLRRTKRIGDVDS